MRGHIAHILATVLMVVSLGAAQRPNKSESVNTRSKAAAVAPGKTARTKPYQIGTASWYGSYFQGRATASGEPYDMYDLTAAHPTLPLGSWVRVTNLRNGRAVVVRINDRGTDRARAHHRSLVQHRARAPIRLERLAARAPGRRKQPDAKTAQPQMMAALQY